MWNDTETPLAYLITFRTYGTWLHGDERGSVNRFRNTFGTRYLPANDKWIKTNQARLKRETVILDAKQRRCVEKAVRETCRKRGWTRVMRETGNWLEFGSPWVDKGSCRNLWNERSVERAVNYVLYGQGDELPDLD